MLLRFFHSINKASKTIGPCFPNPWIVQQRGYLVVALSLMIFSHPLQNRVPRVRSLLPLPKQQVSLLRCLLFFVCAKKQPKALGECRALSTSAACGRYSGVITAHRSAEKQRSLEVFRRIPQEWLWSDLYSFSSSKYHLKESRFYGLFGIFIRIYFWSRFRRMH